MMTNPDLLNNLMLTFPSPYEGLSDKAKELIIKEKMVAVLKEIVEKLNESNKDVYFRIEWLTHIPAHKCDSEGRLYTSGFNKQTQSDYCGYCDCEPDSEDEELSDNAPLEDLVFKLYYTWIQKCDLGHTHKTVRFYIYSMPKVFEMISFYLNNPEWKEGFIKAYVPNFFY